MHPLAIVSISQEKVPMPPKGVPAHLIAISAFLIKIVNKQHF